MTPELTNAIGMLTARELIKINVPQNCADDPEIAQILAERVPALSCVVQ